MMLTVDIAYGGFALIICSLGYVHPLPVTSEENTPICTSYGSLCDVTLDITDSSGRSAPLNYSPQKMCKCPKTSRPCPTASDNDPTRTIKHYLSASGDQTVVVRMSYCNGRKTPHRDCSHGEVALRVMGFGPIIQEIVGDLQCRCSTPLSLRRARPKGFMTEQEYVCGQDVCDVNRTQEPVCERVTRGNTDVPCACPAGYKCSVESDVPYFISKSVFYCKQTPSRQ